MDLVIWKNFGFQNHELRKKKIISLITLFVVLAISFLLIIIV